MPRNAPLLALVLTAVPAVCGVAQADEAERIVDVLALSQGMSVADVGAGDGDWSLVLAEAVGPEGTVYATEVEADLVAELGELGLDNFRANIVAVLGGERSTGLEAGCCDAVLLRMVYHHFTEPQAMRASLFEALRPGGRIAVIDITPQIGWSELDGVPDRGGHGIEIEDVVAEMLGAGFVLEAAYPDWRGSDEDRYCAVFSKPVKAPAP